MVLKLSISLPDLFFNKPLKIKLHIFATYTCFLPTTSDVFYPLVFDDTNTFYSCGAPYLQISQILFLE